MRQFGPAESARTRAMQAQAREIQSHRRAINLQESSAIMFDHAHRTGRSRNARQRADHAREMLMQARAELERNGKVLSRVSLRQPDLMNFDRPRHSAVMTTLRGAAPYLARWS
jgi:hypothetical protein